VKYLEKILEALFSHKAGVCMVAGLAFAFLGVFDIADFKSLTLRSPAAWLPIALGLCLFIVGILLHVFERPAKGSLNEFTAFYEARTADLSPPDLLFLAIAGHFTFASSHGERVAYLNPEWRHNQEHWQRRSTFMEGLGLLQRNGSNEVVRSPFGTAIVYLALKDERFADVAKAMRSDGELADKWRLNPASGQPGTVTPPTGT
jgi:hypothetical protein